MPAWAAWPTLVALGQPSGQQHRGHSRRAVQRRGASSLSLCNLSILSECSADSTRRTGTQDAVMSIE